MKVKIDKITFSVFTDAASFNNGRKISRLPEHSCSAGILTLGDDVLMTGINYNPNTSISYGEIYAIYMMLTEIDNLLYDEEFRVVLHSDSAYCVQAINDWMFNWRKKTIGGIWQSSTGPVAYQLIFEEISKILMKRKGDIIIKHVSGHIDMSKKKHVEKAVKRYKRFNKEVIGKEALQRLTMYNDLCDKMAKRALKQSMEGETKYVGFRPRFEKFISSQDSDLPRERKRSSNEGFFKSY